MRVWEVCGGGKEKIVFINYLHLVVFLLVVINVVKKIVRKKREKINKRARRAECVCEDSGFCLV